MKPAPRHALVLALAIGLAGSLGCLGCKGKGKGKASDKSKVTKQAAATDSASDAKAAGPPPPIGVKGIAIERRDPAAPREIYPRQLAKKLAALLGASPHFVTNPADGANLLAAKLRVVVEYNAVAKADAGMVAAVIRIDLVWEDIERWMPSRARVIAERKLTAAEAKNLAGVTAGHVERAVLDAGKQLIAAESLRRATPATIMAVLKSGDSERTEWALTVVAERALTEAFPVVVPLLDSADTRIRGGAVGALVALRDPRGVDALTKRASFGDSAFLRTVIEAVSVIGGEDAQTYLEFLSTGHEDPTIKEQAKEALRRVVQARKR